ncbi:hypothetical protein SCLCIDRAFT_6301 [Scleroderma citrinum Foug A]|uniref:Uncharacterized protein n=1 Tax=Scleroderma citrinum Foug A TaxID=1036808 RepID=A0A0C3ERN1_9AGAM|nr:hypothetical protein SCLCIDRAFT_6301 [Scleroderma citrinum Foug A]
MKSIALDKLLAASSDLSFNNTHFKYQIASPSMLRPLTSHAMLYTLACIQSLAPTLRKKSNWYRDHMDPLVINDMQDSHWTLSKLESRQFLEALYPDSGLFQFSVQSQAPSQDPINMPKLLNALRNKSIYGRKDDSDGNELWLNFPTTTTESNMAKFLNAILQMPRQWYADGATTPLKGSNAN